MSSGASNSTDSSIASEVKEQQAENCLSSPQVSERFRQRMRHSLEPLWERSNCACCGRNFLEAKKSLAKFRETLDAPQNGSALAGPAEQLTDNERRIVMSDSFMCRLLARCGNDFKRSQERLLVALAVHRKYSLDNNHTCNVCPQSPGYHSFRQVGFDRLGRPVLYTCLNQDLETGTQPQQIKDYFLHLIRCVIEAEKTIPEDQHSLVFVFDTNGLGIRHVSTDTVSQFGEMLRYFPARFCYALLLNLGGVTKFVLKPAIHLTGHQDDILVLSNQELEKQLAECFNPPLVRWMMQEMERNKQPKMAFFSAPEKADDHDPRGEPFYVENYIRKRHKSGHRPHASIVVTLGSNIHDATGGS